MRGTAKEEGNRPATATAEAGARTYRSAPARFAARASLAFARAWRRRSSRSGSVILRFGADVAFADRLARIAVPSTPRSGRHIGRTTNRFQFPERALTVAVANVCSSICR